MLKHYCDKCNKAIKAEIVSVRYRGPEVSSWEAGDFCGECAKVATKLVFASKSNSRSNTKKKTVAVKR
ncbi:MAG: hypothetical protein ABH833_01440 [Parcubacteria group bacterium]